MNELVQEMSEIAWKNYLLVKPNSHSDRQGFMAGFKIGIALMLPESYSDNS